MDIATYRTGRGLSLEAFGALVGKSKGHMHQIEATGRCTAPLALEIERVTDGQIDAASLNESIAAARKVAA